MALSTSEFEKDSERRAMKEVRRWLGQDPPTWAEVRYLVDLVPARIGACRAKVTYYLWMAAAVIALAAVWGALTLSDMISPSDQEKYRALFGWCLAAGVPFLAISWYFDYLSDEWVTLLIRVRGRELELEQPTTGRSWWSRIFPK